MHTIAEMSRAGCTSPRGIRLWEERGLLGEVERTTGDTRRYTADQLDKAKVIAAAQFGGFQLDQISEMLESYDAGVEIYDVLTERLTDQIRAAARLAENLPVPAAVRGTPVEYDL